MNKETIERLRALPIESVATRLGMTVSRRKALCPFHADHHASLSFHPRKNTFKCFACGAAGDTITLVMKQLSLTFPNACRWLADEHNIIVAAPQPAAEEEKPREFNAKKYERFFLAPSLSPRAKEFLFGERKLDERVIAWCRVTSWTDRQGREWLQTPYYDLDRRLVGVQNHFLRPRHTAPGEPIDNSTRRFLFPRGSRCTLYNAPVLRLLKPGEPLYITEGATDCWAMLSAGKKAVAIPSATTLKGDDVRLLTDITARLETPLRMYPDRDVPGECLFMQLHTLLPQLEHRYLPDGCKDFAEYYVKLQTGTAHADL